MKIISNKRYKYYECLVEQSQRKQKSNHDVGLQEVLNFIDNMVLYNKISICDVPISIRCMSSDIYIYAGRYYRNNCPERYDELIEQIKNDITLNKNNQDLLRQYDHLIYAKQYI